MTLRGRGGQGHDANFNMNFEPSFLIVGLELVSTRSYTMSVMSANDTYMYICHCLQFQV